MTFKGAVVKEQGLTFGIVVVKESAIRDSSTANNMILQSESLMGVSPVVLMAQDSKGAPRYYGRKDVVSFLASIDFRRIPWKEYTYSG